MLIKDSKEGATNSLLGNRSCHFLWLQRKLRQGLLDNHSFHINKYHQLEVSKEGATDALLGNRYKDIYFELVLHKVRRLYHPGKGLV